MPTVEVCQELDAPIDEVWDLICGVEAYRRMEPVRSLEVLSEGHNWVITRWEVELKGNILIWTQRETRDQQNHRIEYQQLDGDLETFDGYWQLTSTAGGSTEAVLNVHFGIGIPMLSEMLDPVAERALRDNSRKMLLSLSAEKDRA